MYLREEGNKVRVNGNRVDHPIRESHLANFNVISCANWVLYSHGFILAVEKSENMRKMSDSEQTLFDSTFDYNLEM